ncbi:nucleotidyltransferase [Limnoraphis robusta]|uniref:Nucleotidyltransferase n=1 Tax=Limnoraphis robusta CCNP1315 TaxID=3110306 RepID=A0ABU5UAE8_9CYAN|nr:nucleotidyltransferase [Limnoraphis robusta]MEA5523093.1 nucleotidyltransferase [Limnoraphis robusta CCNP1315]MEA5548081.1 nucleotidyltransferase [Limnoraphis robusta CCNP1324]
MGEILAIGKILAVDEAGFIIREASINKITPEWRLLVDQVILAYQNYWHHAIDSIYIRGSVAVGKAISGVSDLDSFAVVNTEKSQLDDSWFDSFQEQLKFQYPFCTGVELKALESDCLLNLNLDSYHNLRMLLKTQAACVWGEDISLQFPPCKPDINAVSHAFDLEQDLQRVIIDLQQLDETQSGTVEKICQWIMKRMVRSGFEIVMETAQCYTRDLYPCYELFSRYFPQQKSQMYQALTWAINPIDERVKISEFLNSFGGWLVSEIDLCYPPLDDL